MNNLIQNLSISKKLILSLVFVGLLPLLVVGISSEQQAETLLERQAFSQLEAVTEIKSNAVERYFEQVKSQIVTQSNNRMIANAMRSFRQTFKGYIKSERLTEVELTSMRNSLAEYYTQDFSKRYQEENDGDVPDTDSLLAQLGDISIALQYNYISNNAQPIGAKHLLDRGEGRSSYHPLHERYHIPIRKFLLEFGYYDIFLVDLESGNIVYSVYKELDYGTSLRSGPYSDTNFAEVFRKAADELNEGEIAFADFDLYQPSYEAPASFIASPIFSEGYKIGVLIFQIPLENVGTIMGDRNGMGETGESYLVGPDKLMRSDSFFEPETHSVSSSFKYPQRGRVDTEASEKALSGKAGTGIIQDYNGQQVLSSYRSVNILGITWASISEIDVTEAMEPVSILIKSILFIGVFTTIGILIVALLISKMIATPIKLMAGLIQEVDTTGNFSLTIENQGRDEVGTTAQAFNRMLALLSSAFGETNSVLKSLSEGNYEKEISGSYRGQLLELTNGVNQTVRQLKASYEEQEKQTVLAKLASEDAQKQAQAANESMLEAEKQAKLASDNRAQAEAQTKIAEGQRLEAEKQTELAKISALDAEKHAEMAQKSRDQAEAQTKIAESERQEAERQTDLAKTSALDAESQKKTAQEHADVAQASQRKAQELASEAGRVKQALDCVNTNTLIADKNMEIIYLNDSAKLMFREAEQDINSEIPGFSSSELIGQNISIFRSRSNSTAMFERPITNMIEAEFEIGVRTFYVVSNPIYGDGKESVGVVMEWTDRTVEKHIEQEIDSLIEEASKGNFAQSLNVSNKSGFYKSISEKLNTLVSTTEQGLSDIARVLEAIAKGDLNETISKQYYGSFGRLKADTNLTVDKLNEVIEGINRAASDVTQGSQEIAAGNFDLSKRTEDQSSFLEKTTSEMERLTQAVLSNSEKVKRCSTLSNDAGSIAKQGGQVVSQAISAMEKIDQSSKKISDIITVIDGIAFQTNLLALNAAVEAARAGEQGRGFAVVAGEVRNLAQRSADAAKQINELIKESLGNVKEGSDLVNASGERLSKIVESFEDVSKLIMSINDGAKVQEEGIDEVNNSIQRIEAITQQNSALVEQVSASSKSVADQAGSMNALISFFNPK